MNNVCCTQLIKNNAANRIRKGSTPCTQQCWGHTWSAAVISHFEKEIEVLSVSREGQLMKGLGNMSFEEWLRVLGFLVSRRRGSRGISLLSMSAWKEFVARFLTGLFCCACSEGTRKNDLKVRKGKFSLGIVTLGWSGIVIGSGRLSPLWSHPAWRCLRDVHCKKSISNYDSEKLWYR